MEFAGNDRLFLEDCNNLSENFKMSLIQGFCKVPDGNKLQALLFWVVFATPQTLSLPFCGFGSATFKNKSSGIELFNTSAFVTFDKNSTKHSWIQRVPLEESLQGVEELELNVKVQELDTKHSAYSWVEKCWVEKCGVHSDIDGEKWDHEIDLHALGSSATDDQRLESSLIRELRKWKIMKLENRSGFVQLR
ncbi:hypothetical protein OIU77_007019 [Salix suchowensis]|uniref:Uncharacterized protein n=1 Tax=Salix suchowensis TaxID=1278906 RepID=A0ABQ9ANU4_9ROSI|nr:hypothetical protein OIU77_007019 [Salix suchowensis]